MNTKEEGPEKEYEILRAEMLQYMEEYQTVRNMMYAATAAILGLNEALWDNYYLFLLPLLVILPSYLNFYDYWKSVACASTYIQVFLEKDMTQQTYRWESRHRNFSILLTHESRKNRRRITDLGMHFQQIPYFVCGSLCLILYWIKMIDRRVRPYIQQTLTGTISNVWRAAGSGFSAHGLNSVAALSVLFDLLLGISAVVLCVYIWIKFLRVREQEYCAIWERVKKPGKQDQEILEKGRNQP